MQHRHRQATGKHCKLLITRHQNDQWLRHIGRDRTTGRPIRHVGARRMNGRQRSGIFRACRCGADITFRANKQPQVFLCMGCEGIVHTQVRPFVGPAGALGMPQEGMSTRLRSSAAPDLSLRRPI